MSKLKAIAIFAVAVIFVIMGVSIQVLSKNLKQEKAAKERLWNNNLVLSAEKRQYIKLIYTKDEFIELMSGSVKKALDSLKIKPKTVDKIIYRTIIQREYDTVFVPVNSLGNNQWSVKDTGNCFLWSGVVTILSEDSINVKRTEFVYHNATTDYFYAVRPHKFLCIKWGKKIIKQITVPKCGAATERVIEILKNK